MYSAMSFFCFLYLDPGSQSAFVFLEPGMRNVLPWLVTVSIYYDLRLISVSYDLYCYHGICISYDLYVLCRTRACPISCNAIFFIFFYFFSTIIMSYAYLMIYMYDLCRTRACSISCNAIFVMSHTHTHTHTHTTHTHTTHTLTHTRTHAHTHTHTNQHGICIYIHKSTREVRGACRA